MTDTLPPIPHRPHRPRVMPVLLLQGDLLYKTQQFKDPKYVGDPRIAVKIFNDKGADEIVLLDIQATRQNRGPNFALIEEIAGEAFMPMAYGGGITQLDEVKRLFALGVEKVVLSRIAVEDPDFISQAARIHGSQSIAVCLDVKKDWLGRYRLYTRNGTRRCNTDPVEFAKIAAAAGAGELVVNSIDRDGTFKGYDTALINQIASVVSVPVIACGGAKDHEDLGRVVREGHASAAAAGSLFIFQGPHRAVLITFPDEARLGSIFGG